MKTKRTSPIISIEPTEDDIRVYAYHLFEQSGCVPGRDLDNWLEAKACILANIPTHSVHTRLHRNLNRTVVAGPGKVTVVELQAPEASAAKSILESGGDVLKAAAKNRQ